MAIEFQCPTCTTKLNESLSCGKCKKTYLFKEGIYQFVEDKDTQTWDTYWKRTPVYDDIMDILRKMMNMQLRRYIEKFLPISGKSLEPGGGSAYVSAMLASKGYEAYALDYASVALKLATEQLHSKAVLVQGDLCHMPFVDGQFDVTFNNSTMEHFARERALEGVVEMKRVTKKNGFVFVGVPFTYGPLCIYKLKKNSFKGAWDGTTYDRAGLKKLFSDAGLEVVGSRTFFFRCFIGVVGRKVD